MIVGNGDIAKVLVDREGFIFFASGVSNSNCIEDAQYQREVDLFCKYAHEESCLVYFSTISIYDKQSRYIRHKIMMEKLIKIWFTNYCIIRIGNIDWGSNPNTFLNFLRNKKNKLEPLEIRDEYKYMISKEQLLFVTNNIPAVGQNEICVFGYKAKVKDLLL